MRYSFHVNGSRMSGCRLGQPGTPDSTTAPGKCQIFVSDAGPDSCSAWVPGCTLGIRAAGSFLGWADPRVDISLSLAGMGFYLPPGISREESVSCPDGWL